MVPTTLLYRCETWRMYKKQLKKPWRISIDIFLPKSCELGRSGCWSNIFSLEYEMFVTREAHFAEYRLRLAGQIVWMDENGIVLCKYSIATRKPVPEKSIDVKTSFENTLRKCNIDHENWESLAAGGQNWRKSIWEGMLHFNSSKIANKQAAKEYRTVPTASPCPSSVPFVPRYSWGLVIW